MGQNGKVSPLVIINHNSVNDEDVNRKDESLKETDQPSKITSKTVLINLIRLVGFLACFYFFIISLDLMSSGFRLLAG